MAGQFHLHPLGHPDPALDCEQHQTDHNNPDHQFHPRIARWFSGPFGHSQQVAWIKHDPFYLNQPKNTQLFWPAQNFTLTIVAVPRTST